MESPAGHWVSSKPRTGVLNIWVHFPKEKQLLTYSKCHKGASKEDWKKPQYNSVSASGVRGGEGCYPDSPRSKGEDCRMRVKVRLGREHPYSKLLGQISAKEEQLIRDTVTAVFKINFKNCLLYASDIG